VNVNYFSILGYVSVALWMLVPVLMALHMKLRPRRWLCHCAVVIALLAYLLAKINSVNYVERIQPDQSAAIAAAEAERQAAVKAAEAARSDAAAKVVFAEDSHDAKLDKGGMDESDLKYMAKVAEASTEPAWKQKKKQRSGSKADGSLEALVGTDEGAGKGMAKASEAEQEQEPLVMPQRDVERANRLDKANLLIIRLLVLAAFLMVVFDYLRRFNVYSEAYLPLPLPSAWLNALSPLAPLSERPSPPRRTCLEELAWLGRRGDVFLVLTDNSVFADQIPSLLPRLGKRGGSREILRVKAGDRILSDDFIFEALWYGRCSFVVDSSERIQVLLQRLLALLAERKACSARVSQTVHLVWNCQTPPPARWQTEGVRLMQATGFTLLICK
jgi:hypothetical protein